LSAVTNKYLHSIALLGEATGQARTLRASSVVDLALCVAQTMIGQHFETNREPLLETVKSALTTLDTGTRVIKMHPDDYEAILSDVEALDSEIKLGVDESLSPGDCLIETDTSVVDLTTASRLSAMRDELVELLSEEQLNC
jgi:flagellar assembly protein FliH